MTHIVTGPYIIYLPLKHFVIIIINNSYFRLDFDTLIQSLQSRTALREYSIRLIVLEENVMFSVMLDVFLIKTSDLGDLLWIPRDMKLPSRYISDINLIL